MPSHDKKRKLGTPDFYVLNFSNVSKHFSRKKGASPKICMMSVG